jgi:hypothetical protein
MGSPKLPEVPDTPPPATEIDTEQAGQLEKSLLRRRKGRSEAFLTKGQKKPSLLG